MHLTSQRNWPAFASLCAALILITPIWIVDWPAIPDYPAHFAGYYLIAGGTHAPFLSHIYRIQWAPIPNLAAEIIVPLLGALIPILTATKTFLTMTVALWVAGPALIYRALYGRFGAAPLIAAAFAYNGNFMWGFLNYCFAAGLCFVIFAAWVWTAKQRNLLRLVAFAVAATVVYFCHLFGAALLMLLIGCFEVGTIIAERQFSWRQIAARLAAIAFVFLPAAIAFHFKPIADGESDIGFNILETTNDRIDSALARYFNEPSSHVVIHTPGVASRHAVSAPRIASQADVVAPSGRRRLCCVGAGVGHGRLGYRPAPACRVVQLIVCGDGNPHRAPRDRGHRRPRLWQCSLSTPRPLPPIGGPTTRK